MRIVFRLSHLPLCYVHKYAGTGLHNEVEVLCDRLLHWRANHAKSGEVLMSCIAFCAPLDHLLLWNPLTAEYFQWAACVVA
jgi:hypothetical protein